MGALPTKDRRTPLPSYRPYYPGLFAEEKEADPFVVWMRRERGKRQGWDVWKLQGQGKEKKKEGDITKDRGTWHGCSQTILCWVKVAQTPHWTLRKKDTTKRRGDINMLLCFGFLRAGLHPHQPTNGCLPAVADAAEHAFDYRLLEVGYRVLLDSNQDAPSTVSMYALVVRRPSMARVKYSPTIPHHRYSRAKLNEHWYLAFFFLFLN